MKSLIVALIVLTSVASLQAQTLSAAHETEQLPSIVTDSTMRTMEDSLEALELSSRANPQKKFLENDIAFGGTIGTPGGFNFIAEGYYNCFGLRLEGGAFPGIFIFASGYQTDFSYVFARSPLVLYEISATNFRGYTFFFDDLPRWTSGIGIAFGVDAAGFFFQMGAGHTNSIDSYGNRNNASRLINSWPMEFQIGYVH